MRTKTSREEACEQGANSGREWGHHCNGRRIMAVKREDADAATPFTTRSVTTKVPSMR
jgi:hypothetical protein